MRGVDDADDDFEDDFDPWTATGASDLVAAGNALAGAVQEHARVLAALTESQDMQAVFAASEVLLPFVLAYADAQFNLTGNGFPFGPLHDFAEEDEEDGDEQEAVVGNGLSILSRQDFILTDEKAALAAGRAAYEAVCPEDPSTAAAADVTHIGRALYQYAHLNGWDKVKEMPGLVPTGAVTVVHVHEELLRGHPDEWPDEPFTIDAPVIYSQRDSAAARSINE